MGSPDILYSQAVADGGTQTQQNTDQKFQSDAYDARQRSGGDKAGSDQRRLFDGKGLFGRREAPRRGADDGAGLEKEGGIESLKLPKGFKKGTVEKEDNYMEFPAGTSKDTKVCYWRRTDFVASDDDVKKINEVMKKPPHELKEQEILDIIPTMAPGRWAGNGNFKQLSLRTEDVAGKRVIVGDFKFNDQDKKVHVIIANPDKAKQQIEVLWLEGSNRDYEANKKAVLESFSKMKWTDTPAPPPAPPPSFRLRR